MQVMNDGLRPANQGRFRPSRAVKAAAWAAVSMLSLVACGSSNSSSASSGSTAGSGGSSGATASPAPSGGGSANVAAAQQATQAAMQVPSHINQTVPLKSKPAPGKTIVFIQCELSPCANIGNGVEAGTRALGWTYKKLSYLSSNPASLLTGMQQALQYHPFAVSFSGIPQAVWASEVPAYKQAGVYILPVVIGPTTLSPTVPANLGDFTSGGKAMADWLIAQSDGKGKTLLAGLPAFPILTTFLTGVSEELSAKCPTCSTTSFDGTLAEVGGGQYVPDIVTALKKDRSIKYIISCDLAFDTGLSSALNAAGITGVKIAGSQPEPQDLAAIKAGTEAAAEYISDPIEGWMVADSAARLSEGMTVPPGDSGTPQQLLTSANVGSPDLNAHIEPADYSQQFKALWKVG